MEFPNIEHLGLKLFKPFGEESRNFVIYARDLESLLEKGACMETKWREEQYQLPLYRLKKDAPLARAGTIFYYDESDQRKGSIAAGCLKMAWTEDGNCQNNLCADTIVFHASAIDDKEWFEPIKCESAEDVLRLFVDWANEDRISNTQLDNLKERAKRALEPA